jgi:glyoxylase-like metal-dependent hydrolase (beta-lactamase superfamily II)
MSTDAGSGYTGDVRVGGPADVRRLPGLQWTKLAAGPYDNNVYLLRCLATGDTLLVDAAASVEQVVDALGDGRLVGITITHGHFDHVQTLDALRTRFAVPVACHGADAGMLPSPPDRRLADGDVIEIGEASAQAIHLEGHTPGGVALLYDADGALADAPHLITGDSLFPGGPGNTDHDAQRFSLLMDDLERKIFGPLPDATWVYPGHGKDTTLGRERPHLAEWRDRGW